MKRRNSPVETIVPSSTRLRVAHGLVLAGMVLAVVSAKAATYYVDSNIGNDVLDGKAAAVAGGAGPWRSLARLARASLLPGDKVVLACGSVWRETLRITASGTLSYPIIVGAPSAGCTARPTVDGSVDVPPSAWRLVQGQLFQAQLSTPPLQLYSGNSVWMPATHPNRGYDTARPAARFLPMAGNGAQVTIGGRVRSTTIVTGSELKLPAGATVPVGTQVRIRTTAWAIEDRRVTANSAGVLSLDTPTAYPALAGWGYVLMGQPWMVDSPGEWHHDPTTGRLLAWIPGAGAPTSTISAAVLGKGIDLQGLSFVQLDGLVVRYVGVGLALRGTRGVQVRGVSVQDTADLGADTSGSSGLVLEGNAFLRTGKDAIQGVLEGVPPADGLVVRGNTIRDSALVSNNEDIVSVPASSAAAINTGTNAVVEGNSLTNAAYIGIRFMRGARIERNTISGACSVLDDCGAIYAWGSDPNNSAVRLNIVSRVRGNIDGKPAGSSTAAQGIYLDDYTSGVLVEQNTVTDADNGIQVHLGLRNTLRGNVLYGNRNAQVWMQANKNAINAMGDVVGNVVTGNVIAPLSTSSVGMRLDSSWSSTSQFGTFSGNRYLESTTMASVQERTSLGTRTLSFKEWQSSSGIGSTSPVDSDGYTTSSEPYANLIVSGPNVIANNLYATNTSGWSTWNQTAPYGQLIRETCSVGGAGYCARYIPGGSAGLVSSPNFSVVQGRWYRLSVDLLADQAAQKVNVIVRRGGGGTNGYEPLSDRGIAFNASNVWRRFSIIFQAIKTVNKADPLTKDLGARVDIDQLTSGKSIVLGNMELVPVTVAPVNAIVSMAVNANALNQSINCPYIATGTPVCSQSARLSDGVTAQWPMLISGSRSEVVFARLTSQYDSDRDGIPDAQDACPGTAAGAGVNSVGCALGQR